MKLFGLFAAAGLVAASATLGTAAPAQERVVTRTTTTTVHRDARIRPAIRHRQKVCRTRWHNGHKVRRCTRR